MLENYILNFTITSSQNLLGVDIKWFHDSYCGQYLAVAKKKDNAHPATKAKMFSEQVGSCVQHTDLLM